jgi:hypothetical protein
MHKGILRNLCVDTGCFVQLPDYKRFSCPNDANFLKILCKF